MQRARGWMSDSADGVGGQTKHTALAAQSCHRHTCTPTFADGRDEDDGGDVIKRVQPLAPLVLLAANVVDRERHLRAQRMKRRSGDDWNLD